MAMAHVGADNDWLSGAEPMYIGRDISDSPHNQSVLFAQLLAFNRFLILMIIRGFII